MHGGWPHSHVESADRRCWRDRLELRFSWGPMRRVIALAAVLATTTAVAAGFALARSAATLGTQPVAMAIALTVVLCVPLRFRHRGVNHHLTLDEAILVPGLALLAFDHFVLAVVAAHLAVNAMGRRGAVRTAFNVGVHGFAALVMAAVWLEAAPLGLVAQALMAGIIHQALSALLFVVMLTWREGGDTPVALGHLGPVLAVAGIAGPAVGIGLAQWGARWWPAVVVGVLPLVAVVASVRAAVALSLQRRRAEQLREVSSCLTRVERVPQDLAPTLAAVAALFDAGGAALRLPDGTSLDVGTARVESLDDLALSLGAALGAGRILAVALAGPIEGGVLAVTDRSVLEPWDRTDIALLRSVADELMVACARCQLMAELKVERHDLAQRTHLLDDLLGATTDGILLLGGDGTVRTWNPAMATLTGVPAAAALGRPWWEVLVAEDRDGGRLGPERPGCLATVQAVVDTLRVGAHHPRWVRAACAPLTDGGTAAVMHDMTRQHEVERMKADFVATVSHELRTPMTPLRGAVQTLLNHGDRLDEAQRLALLQSQARQVDRLEALIEDLLMVAEMGAEATRASDAMPIDVPGIVHRVVAQLDVDSRRVTVVAPAQCSAGLGTPTAVERVVWELVDNALVHGTGDVTVVVADDGLRVVVEVRDSGPGIPPAHQETIFEQFHRLGDPLQRPQGPGLGLTVVRTLARQDGGDVTLAESSPAGSSFRFAIPSVRTRLAPLRLDRGKRVEPQSVPTTSAASSAAVGPAASQGPTSSASSAS